MKLTVFTDGGSRGNPGKAAYGFVIFDEKNSVVFEEGKTIGIATNNVAEYTAIEMSLLYLSKNLRNQIVSITFFMDSLLAAMQLSGKYKIKNENLRLIINRIHILQKELNVKVEYRHIPREQNKKADALLNAALDAEV